MTPSTERLRIGAALALAILAACAAPPPRMPAMRAPIPASAPATNPIPAPATMAAAVPGQPPTAVPAAAQPRFAAALKLLKEGDLPAAREAFLALHRDFPLLSGPLTDLGIVYARNREPDLAMASFAKAAALNPRNVVALNWLGTLCRERGDYSRAENAYRRALAADAGYAPAWLNLAILYDNNLRRPQQALAHYREYQRLAAAPNPMVAVWIKELEGAPAPALASAGAAP